MKKLLLITALLAIANLYSEQASEAENTELQNDKTQTTVEQTEESSSRLLVLLSGYLENDLELQQNALSVQQSKLTQKTTKINNGIDISLQTGTVTLSKSGNSTRFTAYPSVTVSVPQAAGLKLTGSTSITPEVSSVSSTYAQDFKLKAQADIISETAANRKVTLIKAERSVLEARRNLQNRAVEAEQEFYESLKKIFTNYCTVLEAQKTLYDDEIDFQTIKAQGYGTSSSKYRLAELQVVSDRRTINEALRVLEKDTAVFASKCGLSFESTSSVDDTEKMLSQIASFLPESIMEVSAIEIGSLKKENYTDIENAEWNLYINDLTRKADKEFGLNVYGGYTFSNLNTKTDTTDIGFGLSWRGITTSFGVGLPTGANASSSSPAVTFSVSLSPSSFFLRSITKQQYELSSKQDELALKSAESDYETSIISQETSIRNTLWNKISNTESYKMYFDLEADLRKYYDLGLVAESEYLQAKVNRDDYFYKCLINNIDVLIYNAETKLLFINDEELNGESNEKK